MDKLKIFESSEFGKVRTMLVDGEPFFVGKDVAKILGYSNPQKALRDHVVAEDKTMNESFTVNGTQGILINESGLYSLSVDSVEGRACEPQAVGGVKRCAGAADCGVAT